MQILFLLFLLPLAQSDVGTGMGSLYNNPLGSRYTNAAWKVVDEQQQVVLSSRFCLHPLSRARHPAYLYLCLCFVLSSLVIGHAQPCDCCRTAACPSPCPASPPRALRNCPADTCWNVQLSFSHLPNRAKVKQIPDVDGM